MLGHRHKWPWRENHDSHAWAKVFRIMSEFRNLELTFESQSPNPELEYIRKSAPKI